MKKVWVVLLVIIGLVVVAEISAPYLIARGLEVGLNKTLGVDVQLRLKSYPSLRMLLGQFDHISVVAKNVNLGGLSVSEYTLIAQEVDVNVRSLLGRRELTFNNQGNMEVQVVVAEGELSTYLWENIPELKGWRVQVNQGSVTVVGQAPILNAMVDMRLQGKFVPQGADKLAFIPELLELQNITLPQGVVDAVLQGAEFYIDLAAAPMPLELLDVKMEPGQLVLRAKVLQ
ncbi:MAG: hypothetical protein FD169_1425 [Bacillota bacterium]|nr:MAG: hypothetical protein FD169_1425 [Bacillota bacterium]MBS3950397.1 DUF2993 domain-containing protein [Peptococcaceae bacterium]